MVDIKALKKQLSSGTIDAKKQAYLELISGSETDEKLTEYLVGKLAKLPSSTLFDAVIKTEEAKSLPLMDIYRRRLVECKNDKARRDTLKFSAFSRDPESYQRIIPWRDGDPAILKSVITNDSDLYVRDDAFRFFIASFGEQYPTPAMYELAELCIAKPHDDGGILLRTAYHSIPSLPYSDEMIEFIQNRVTRHPIDHELDTLITSFQEHHPDKFLPLVPVVKQVIDDYIKTQNPSFLKGLFGNKSNAPEHDKAHIKSLAHGLLQACETDKAVLLYIQNVAAALDYDELSKFVLVKLTYVFSYDFEFAENEIYNVIKDTKKSDYVRLFAVEKLKDFYKRREVSPPKDTITTILSMYSGSDDVTESQIIETFGPIDETFAPVTAQIATSKVLNTIPDERCRVFFESISKPWTDDESALVWNRFLSQFHASESNLDGFINDMIDAQTALSFNRKTVFQLDIRAVDGIELQIEKTAKLLAPSTDISVYQQDSDYSLGGIEQLSLLASAIKAHGYSILEVDMGWDEYLAFIVAESNKPALEAFLKDYNFYQSFRYL